MILQNAIQVCETGQILISAHRHDYVTVEVDGEQVMLDGGNDYFRASDNIMELEQAGFIRDLRLDDTDPIDGIVDKIIWGTNGPNGDQKTRWVFLKDCETDHLEKIASFYRLAPKRKEAIKLILERRKHANSDKS